MLIDTFAPDWIQQLDEEYKARIDGAAIHLLIDGAFVPGLHKRIIDNKDVYMIYRGLPGFDEATRNVSPFVVPYMPQDRKLHTLLEECDGWPMVSAITTTENAEDLARRLAAWCVIESSGQHLNFRFPDTRRLPDVLAVLTSGQLAELTGPASAWSYIGRTGEWIKVTLRPSLTTLAVCPKLNEIQFASLIDRGDVDAVLARVRSIGCKPKLDIRSLQYSVVEASMAIAEKNQLKGERLFWYRYCLESAISSDGEIVEALFMDWVAKELAIERERIEL